jgi:translation elongation factor EF-Tu-like GTPase
MDNKKVHIGVVGYKDHSKTTLKYALSLIEGKNNNSNEIKEYDVTKIRFEEYIPKEEKPKVKNKKYNIRKK